MFRSFPLVLIGLLAPQALLAAEGPAPPALISPRTGDTLFGVSGPWMPDGRMVLLAPDRNFNVTRVYVKELDGAALTVGYDKEATQSFLLRPPGDADIEAEDIRLEVTDSAAGQYQDGRIVLLANHATVHGATAKLESQPGNERIGFWSNPKDFVSWNYKATRPGRYDAFLTYSCAEKSGTKISVEIGKEKLDGALTTTQNGWYGYTWMKLGNVSIPAAGPLTVSVRCREMVGGAVMNLKAITLMPACEGTPPVQAPDGTVTLHAKDATIWGVQAQYEPKPQKNTIGYWTHATDTASWLFNVTKPGEFDIEILQGCGKGQGGSKVEIEVSDERQHVLMPFTVEDTGHFQNFVARNIGAVNLNRAGKYTLVVRPVNRAGVAVMDLRQVRLLPK